MFASHSRSDFGSRESTSSEKQRLTIYDLDNKFIAYSASFDDVVDVVAEWGSFYILTRDGKMLVLQEKDTQTKLEVGPRGAGGSGVSAAGAEEQVLLKALTRCPWRGSAAASPPPPCLLDAV